MGFFCSKVNHNKISTNKDKKSVENNQLEKKNPLEIENKVDIKKEDSVPLSKLFDFQEKNKDSKADLQKHQKSDENIFLSNKIPFSELSTLEGSKILTIKESGQVLTKFGETLGFFRDNYQYTSQNETISGKLDRESQVRDKYDSILGKFSEKGMIYDKNGLIIGKIDEELGYFRNEKFMVIANGKGEIKLLAIIFYFLHPEIKSEF